MVKDGKTSSGAKVWPEGVLLKAPPFRYIEAKISARQIERLKEIAPYFTPDVLVDLLIPIATQTFEVSLRVLDFCCTNYAKKTRVVAELQTENGHEPVHLFSMYKDWLRHYRRKTFDPFRRRERIWFEDPRNPGVVLETTVAQLNFLRWANIYGIIQYVKANLENIENDMMKTLCGSKKRRAEDEARGNKKRRTELSRPPACKCIVYEIHQNVTFEQ